MTETTPPDPHAGSPPPTPPPNEPPQGNPSMPPYTPPNGAGAPPPTPYKRLYRSRNDRMIAGVCGGVAEYFNVDPMIIRLAWALLSVAGGAGLLAYIIAWIVVPESP